MSVRLMHYDPRIKSFFPYTTPREFVLWAHRLFPILVFTIVVINKVYFIDMEAHRQRLLSHMMQQNQVRTLCFKGFHSVLFTSHERPTGDDRQTTRD